MSRRKRDIFLFVGLMIVREIQNILEAWAPKDIAWEHDNIGLQWGSPAQSVRKILVTLDVTEQVIQEAKKNNFDLIVSHHPLLFHPVNSVTDDSRVGRIMLELAKSKISLFSAHTNLDFAHSGVSFTLAENLGLHKIDFLQKISRLSKKIVVFVPSDYVDKVMTAMAEAGAGHIGKYTHCSFKLEGTGTFKGSKDSTPFVGKAGTLENVREIRLEMVVPNWKLNDVLGAARTAHPYEEVAFDVYDLVHESNEYGAGAIGELDREVSLKNFLERVKHSLDIDALRYTGSPKSQIKRVAVCGGSGSDLLGMAIKQGADAFITGDVKYHTFREAEGCIALVDAGHFETERPVIKKIIKYLKKQLATDNENVQVFASTRPKNPIHYC